MSTSDRASLISSAISFLRDPSTSSSPLAQKIAFLESKGLNQVEIEQALSAANGGPLLINPQYGGQRGGMGIGGGIGREFERDWRDWFIMSVVGGGVGWLTIKLAQVSVSSSPLFHWLDRSACKGRFHLEWGKRSASESGPSDQLYRDCRIQSE